MHPYFDYPIFRSDLACLLLRFQTVCLFSYYNCLPVAFWILFQFFPFLLFFYCTVILTEFILYLTFFLIIFLWSPINLRVFFLFLVFLCFLKRCFYSTKWSSYCCSSFYYHFWITICSISLFCTIFPIIQNFFLISI